MTENLSTQSSSTTETLTKDTPDGAKEYLDIAVESLSKDPKFTVDFMRSMLDQVHKDNAQEMTKKLREAFECLDNRPELAKWVFSLCELLDQETQRFVGKYVKENPGIDPYALISVVSFIGSTAVISSLIILTSFLKPKEGDSKVIIKITRDLINERVDNLVNHIFEEKKA